MAGLCCMVTDLSTSLTLHETHYGWGDSCRNLSFYLRKATQKRTERRGNSEINLKVVHNLKDRCHPIA